MAYLIDTQILLWMLEDDPRLSDKAKNIISDSDNSLFLSIASLWEIAIKINVGKLTLSSPLEDIVSSLKLLDINILPIKTEHILALQTLQQIHRDPFDRIIISQAVEEDLSVISADEIFLSYYAKVIS